MCDFASVPVTKQARDAHNQWASRFDGEAILMQIQS